MPSRNWITGAVHASVPANAEPYVTFSHLRASLRPRRGLPGANAGIVATPEETNGTAGSSKTPARPAGQSAFGPISTAAVAAEPPPVSAPNGISPTSAGRPRTPKPAVDLELPDLKRVALALHDVTKVYPNGKHALVDVDLVVPEGDFVFLVGPSGAGKSTLIKLLVRDELATTGMVSWAARISPA